MSKPDDGKGCGPKYWVDIEGTVHAWDQDTITTEQIAELGRWDPAVGVIEIDRENNERILQPGEVVRLKPGMGFSKKIHWKRGLLIEERMGAELALLQTQYPSVEYRDRWIRVPAYPLPEGWSSAETSLAIFIRDGFPGTGPYGLHVPAGIRFLGAMPKNYVEPAKNQPPFGGNWGVFSWEAANWRATADLKSGHNLLNWILGASTRFREGL